MWSKGFWNLDHRFIGKHEFEKTPIDIPFFVLCWRNTVEKFSGTAWWQYYRGGRIIKSSSIRSTPDVVCADKREWKEEMKDQSNETKKILTNHCIHRCVHGKQLICAKCEFGMHSMD